MIATKLMVIAATSLTSYSTLSTLVIENSKFPSIFKTKANNFMVDPCKRKEECPEVSTDLLTWKEYYVKYRKPKMKYYLHQYKKPFRYIKTVYSFPSRKGKFLMFWVLYLLFRRHRRSSLRTIISLNSEFTRKKCHKYAMFKVSCFYLQIWNTNIKDWQINARMTMNVISWCRF